MASGVAVFGIALISAWGATGALIPQLRKMGALAVPNGRSSHAAPTPCGGGLGILVGLAAGLATAWLLGAGWPAANFLLAGLLVACCGWVADWRKEVSIWPRLAVHTLAAVLIIGSYGSLYRLPMPAPLDVPLGLAAWPVSLLWIVGATNIFNFLDGIDGFAGLQGVIAGLAVALMGFGAGTSILGLAVAGACAGFLIHNWHPARIFMGDVGSTTLGFLLAALPFQLEPSRRSEAVFCVAMSLWFFLADGTFTLMRRALRGEKLWEAHRSHLYQLLVRGGMRHDAVVTNVGALAVLVAAVAVAASRAGNPAAQWVSLSVALAGFALYGEWVDVQYRGARKEVGSSVVLHEIGSSESALAARSLEAYTR